MKRRKRIAAIFCDMVDEFHNGITRGIIEKANSLDIDVFFFTTLVAAWRENQYQVGERNIFNLINFDDFDGVIFAESTFFTQDVKEEVVSLLHEKCRVPVQSIGTDLGGFPNVRLQGEDAVEQLVDHFIDEHHFRKIYFLTGPEGNEYAEERAEGYRISMKKHDLPFSENWIFYGDFWRDSAEKLAEDIAKGVIDRPDAVACANDSMAIFLTNKLTDLKVKVPEYIAVCGFDNIPESKTNIPSVTTYSAPNYDLGADAVTRLVNMTDIFDHKIELQRKGGQLILRRSCGCFENEDGLIEEYKRTHIASRSYSDLLRTSFMEEAIYTAKSLPDFVSKLGEFIYLVHGMSSYMMCLCDDWQLPEDDPHSLRGRYSEYTTPFYSSVSGEKLESVPFPTSELLPPALQNLDYPTAFYITPLHFNEYTFGYSVLSFGREACVYDDVYRFWNKNINNALELIRVRGLIVRASITDSLTGIYNRRGFDERASELFREAVRQNTEITVIGVDLDNLKYINDNYGHSLGDRAIISVANLLSEFFYGEDMVCARVGGDEFTVVKLGRAPENYAEQLHEEIDAQLKQIGDRYGMTLGISLGVATAETQNTLSLERLLTEADDAMYNDKSKRKGGRRKTDRT